MATKADRRKSVVASKVGDASEDGDFIALRANRENREEEAVDIALPDFAEILEPIQESNKASQPSGRPQTGRIKRRTAVFGDDLFADLAEGASSGTTAFREVLSKIESNYKLADPRLLNPRNNQNILHFALDLGDQDIANIVTERADEKLIEQTFDVDVVKIAGKKNALHQAVEQNNIPLLKALLSKISSNEKKIAMLKQETPVEIKGQRPRTFPCLHLAAYNGFTDMVVFILDLGIDVNHLNAKKDSSLLWAARWGHLETVQTLLNKGALPNLENDKGSTALYWAVRYGHTETVEVLARKGRADVNQTRKLGLVAPIVLASALGFKEIISILLEFGADPNYAIRGGERPIHHAGREGFSDVIELLISHGAEIDSPDDRGDTALLLTAKHGRPKALQTLLKHGANVNHKNHMGEDVWAYAVQNDNNLILKLLVLHERTEAMEDDIGSGFIQKTSLGGVNSLLLLAASVGNTSRMNLLFQMKVDADATDDDGNNFLHHAAINNQPAVIQEFHKKVSIDSVNKIGNTPLHHACEKGHHEVILELIKAKAMANIRNKRGETALHVAAYSKVIQPHSISRLMEYIIKTHPWECLNISDNQGNNPLHIAAKHARPEVLWEFRFVRFKDPDVDGNIALHEAVRPGEPEVLDMMLDIYDAMKRDCDINHQNNKERTCLYLAAKEGFAEGVKRLMLFGADISLSDHRGNTVLHMLTSLIVTDPAHSWKYMDVIGLILERAPQWYCTLHLMKMPDIKGEEYVYLRRRAILTLVCDFYNTEELSVLDLACKVGASQVIQLLLTMDDVMAFKVGKHTRYDISSITPKSNGTLGGACAKGTVSPRPACLEWLLAAGNDAPQSVGKILDMQPFSDIERAYSSVAAWAYAVLMIVHILYMSLFSWSGLTLLSNNRENPGRRSSDGETLVTYILVPLEPAIIIIYNIYRLVTLCCMGELSIRSKLFQGGTISSLKAFLSVIISIIYSIFVIIWIITYAVDYTYMDYFLSIALCLGWLFTIAFTRGFKVINYFWRLIQIMIVRDVFKFLFIYLFVLLAFSFAFHALFQVSDAVTDLYPNPAYTIFLMFNMMIGMDYVFESSDIDDGLSAVNRTSVFMKVIYVLYMILATIVLLNLLIAMMNDSYQEILNKQRLSWRIESVQLGVDVEKSLPVTFQLFSKVKIMKGFICKSDQDNNIKRWYIEVHKGQVPFFQSRLQDSNRGREALETLKSTMAAMDTRMGEQISALKTNIDDIHIILRNLEHHMAQEKS